MLFVLAVFQCYPLKMFWSHVIFDKDFLNPLLDFFQESTPFYIPLKEIYKDNDDLIELYEKICKNAITIVCRLILNRESEEEFMTKEKHAEILYQNYLISVPMIFDMIALYGYSNKNLIQKIINEVVKIEPKYQNDIKAGIKFIQSTFVTMKKQVLLIEEENRNLFEKYEDLCLYLMNIAVTLNILIELVPLDVKIYCSRELHLEQSITSLYDNLIPTLYKNSIALDSSAWFINFINYARVEMINTFRCLVNRGILALFNASEKTRNKIADEVLSIFTECAGFHTFIKDYTALYPIEMDLDVLQQSDKKIDQIKLKFVSDAYKNDSSTANVANGFHLKSNDEIQNEDCDDDELEGACALPLKKEGPQLPEKNTEDFIQFETCKILELFPEYGAGYIRRLLAFYDNNSETVISKILEESVDESFKKFDKQEPFIPPESPSKIPQSIDKSHDVASSTAAEVMETFNTGHILKNGKNLTKKQPKTIADIINDKSHVNELRDRYKQYSLISGKNDVDDDNEYDDEYDDSYDVFADTEPKIHLKGNMRDVLPDEVESEESESEEEESQQNDPQRKRNPMDFCENPEIIRARREREYQNRMSKKFPNRTVPNRDVVGNAKGKGQSNEVLRNRQQKSANKSSRANHNRKAGSTFKQSRGMY
ncbi:hypothetical protein PVAND_013037 [Polypedilum vanderplanki]|uniref:CUE domain-containing protein n=1 Tax=Polypedilum vanderplanki TaxID=319348 RepID=A0A9J6CP68_POLVA|nr:hypothetical protein PVAND_013037 [Polypedilum vanderplanki]